MMLLDLVILILRHFTISMLLEHLFFEIAGSYHEFLTLTYLVGQNFGAKKCRKFGLSAENFCLPKILSAEIFCPLKFKSHQNNNKLVLKRFSCEVYEEIGN